MIDFEPAAEKFKLRVMRVLDRRMIDLQRYIRTEKLTGGTTPTRLKVRTGRLRASVRPIPAVDLGSAVEAGVAVGTKYARVHFGPKGQVTTIRPKERQYLTIPLPAAMTASGVPRGGATSPQWGDTFVARSKKGNLIIFGRRRLTKGPRAGALRGGVIPLFLLAKAVRVPARIHPEELLDWVRPKIAEDLKRG